MNKSTPAYLVGNYKINDTEMLGQYVAQATPIVEKFGGKIIVFNQNVQPLEGSCKPVFILIEFPSLKNAQAFYNSPEYAPVKPLRLNATERGFLFFTDLIPT